MRAVCEVRGTLPATLEAVDAFCTRCRGRLADLAGPADRFAAELLLRELLTNAVRHGARQNPRSSVYCALRLTKARMTLLVCDEGGGFDWRAAWERPPDDGALGGRGFQILRAYASRVRFSGRGSAVAVTKEFREGKCR